MKTSELTGAALDWAVAKCEGHQSRCPWLLEQQGYTQWQAYERAWGNPIPAYSTDWAQGGPILARKRINIHFCRDLRDINGLYIHAEMDTHSHHGYWRGDHNQPLIAAMRCYVASKLGEEVDVPEELC